MTTRLEECGKVYRLVNLETGKLSDFVFRCKMHNCPHCQAVRVIHGHFTKAAVETAGKN
jgi:hypothetical protein